MAGRIYDAGNEPSQSHPALKTKRQLNAEKNRKKKKAFDLQVPTYPEEAKPETTLAAAKYVERSCPEDAELMCDMLGLPFTPCDQP